jgi:hypothetical protein
MRAGYRTVPAIVSYVTLIVGGSVALTFPWGRKHLLWGIAVLLLAVVVVILAGSYQESLHLEQQNENEMATLRGQYESMLAAQRDEHQSAMNAALTAAVAARADGTVKPDPADWNAHGDYYPPSSLMFTLRHRLDNLAAVFAFSAVQCAVTDPDGVRTEAEDRNISNMRGRLMVQYIPSFFPGAPPVRDGTYRFVWTGQDAKGIWHEITRGSYEVPLPEAADPGDVNVPS